MHHKILGDQIVIPEKIGKFETSNYDDYDGITVAAWDPKAGRMWSIQQHGFIYRIPGNLAQGTWTSLVGGVNPSEKY